MSPKRTRYGSISISTNVHLGGNIHRCPLGLWTLRSSKNDNRRHVHVFYKGKRHQRSLAKIWIEANGQQCVEIAESTLSAKDNEMLVAAINRHWEFINEQVTRAFNGEKTISIDIEK